MAPGGGWNQAVSGLGVRKAAAWPGRRGGDRPPRAAGSRPASPRAQEEPGLSSRAITFEEIASEFGHGQPSAEAVKAFLSYTYDSWQSPSPRYVLLLGDATDDPQRFQAGSTSGVFASWDAPLLRAHSRQPVLFTMNCLNGYFVAPNLDALPEALLKAEGRGVVAVFSSSGPSRDGPAHACHRALVAELASGEHQRLGDPGTKIR